MANVVLGIPTMGSVDAQTFGSLMMLRRGEHKLFPLITEYSLVYIARENIVKRALENPITDYILFIDSDIVVEKDMLELLIQDDKDIVTGIYPYKQPGNLIVGRDLEDKDITLEFFKDKQVKEILKCGLGCCLIKRKVFEDIFEKFVKTEILIR